MSDAISDLTTNDPGTIQSFTDAVNVINAINNNSYPSESQTRSINIGGGPSFPVSARTQAAAGVLALTAAGSGDPNKIKEVLGNLRIWAATSGAKDSAVNPFAVDPVYSAVTGNESLANMNSVLGTSPENPFMGFAFQSINLVTPKVNWENWESFVNGLLGLTFGIGNENKGLRDLLYSDFAGKKQDIIRELAGDPKREEYYQGILRDKLIIFLENVKKCINEGIPPAQCTHEAGGEMGKELENEWKEKEKNKLGTENERKFRNQMAANFYVIQLNMESQNLYSPEAAADETTFTGWYVGEDDGVSKQASFLFNKKKVEASYVSLALTDPKNFRETEVNWNDVGTPNSNLRVFFNKTDNKALFSAFGGNTEEGDTARVAFDPNGVSLFKTVENDETITLEVNGKKYSIEKGDKTPEELEAEARKILGGLEFEGNPVYKDQDTIAGKTPVKCNSCWNLFSDCETATFSCCPQRKMCKDKWGFSKENQGFCTSSC